MKKLFSCILFLMLILTSKSSLAEDREAVARPVTGSQVMKMLYKFPASDSAIRSYVEISEAIAKAATEDPLFPYVEEGSEMTAAILVSVAWHESRFVRDAVGDHGRSFGLYQIQPGSNRVKSNLLTIARDASFIAIGLIRDSIRHCLHKGREWREALAWYAASSEYGSKHPVIISQSRKRMQTAAELFAEFFGVKDDDQKSLGYLLSRKSST